MRNLLLATSVLALAIGHSLAQGAAAQVLGEGEITALETWSYDPLYTDGLSVNQMMDVFAVQGAAGEEIGSIENVIIDDEAQILAIIAQVGGVWDIGDTHVSIPWEQVEIGDEQVIVPLTEETIDDYSIFAEPGFFFDETASEVTAVDDDLETGMGIFKATDLIGDYAYLTGDQRYGYVYDLVIQDDKLTSVVVSADAYGRPGYYAYPYSGYGYGLGMNSWRYDLPYSAEDITIIDTFDYGQMQTSTVGTDGDKS